MKLISKLFLLYLGAIFLVHVVRADISDTGSTNSSASSTNTNSADAGTNSPDTGDDTDNSTADPQPHGTTQSNSSNNKTLTTTPNTSKSAGSSTPAPSPTASGKQGATSPVSTESAITSAPDGTESAPTSPPAVVPTTTLKSNGSNPASGLTSDSDSSVTPTPNASTGAPSANASVTTEMPPVTTQNPPIANGSVTSVKPAVTTQAPAATTQAPAETTTTEVPSSTPAPPTTSQNSTGSTSPPTSGTKTPQPSSSPAASTSVSPPVIHMYINEIMLNKRGGFQTIELYVANPVDLTHFAMVMVDGGTNKTMVVQKFKDAQMTNGLVMITLSNNTDAMMKAQGIGIAIYNIDQASAMFKDDWTVNNAGLVDALVIGRSYEGISTHLVQTLTPGMNPFVLDPSLYGMERTISRCSSNMTCNTDMYALLNPSLGHINNDRCQERLHYHEELSLKFTADCTKFNISSKKEEEKLMHYIIREVNRNCHCGITRMHIKDPQVQCCGGTSLEMNFVAPNENQKEVLLTYYKAFIHSATNVDIDGQSYKLDNTCYSNCCASPMTIAVDDKDKNTRVTVAVVVTCMLIFLVIVILVVLYMRKKKSAVYQFRMSRLEEDDDYPMGVGDQDEFVGGQEATFDIKA